MRTVLILNPTSGTSMMAEAHDTLDSHEAMILDGLRAHGIEPEIWYTTEEDAGEGLARKAADEHADIVIAAGGDGTIHAVASGLIGRESVLGIIAMGTMNNLAHSLAIPTTIEEACNVIAEGETHAIDVGKINGQIFLEVAGIGFEAALFPAAEEIKSSNLLKTLRGVVSGLTTLFTFQPVKLKIALDGQERHQYHAIQVTICNAPFYGAHFHAAPDALMDDGLLDVIIFRHFSKFAYIKHAISISQGRRELQPRIKRCRVKSLRINADHPVEIQADGLPHGYTPATISIMPEALRVRIQNLALANNVPGLRENTQVTRKVHLQTSHPGR
ncbi:MAG: diacylglycerol kinase family protein [Ktedonobacteraceae bacterium]